MSEDPHEVRLRRLRFRAWRRGTREMDLLIGTFADDRLAHMPNDKLDAFEVLLDAPEPDVYAWITGAAQVPKHIDKDIIASLRALTLTPQDYGSKT